MTAQCSTCKFYTEDKLQVDTFGDHKYVGICRVEHPTSHMTKSNLFSIYPIFTPCIPTAWCGEYQASV